MCGTGAYVDALIVIAASGLAVPKLVLRENVFDSDGNLRRGYEMNDDQDLVLKESTGDIVIFPAEIPMVSLLTVRYCEIYMLFSICCRLVVLMSITGIVH